MRALYRRRARGPIWALLLPLFLAFCCSIIPSEYFWGLESGSWALRGYFECLKGFEGAENGGETCGGLSESEKDCKPKGPSIGSCPQRYPPADDSVDVRRVVPGCVRWVVGGDVTSPLGSAFLLRVLLCHWHTASAHVPHTSHTPLHFLLHSTLHPSSPLHQAAVCSTLTSSPPPSNPICNHDEEQTRPQRKPPCSCPRQAGAVSRPAREMAETSPQCASTITEEAKSQKGTRVSMPSIPLGFETLRANQPLLFLDLLASLTSRMPPPLLRTSLEVALAWFISLY
ncbi:uncharacterized protein J3D65DRAFT_279817 [Phyllosticta citribraziliensis]|uniref:Uncharacterized protein n=1 Tax=Phyllosticta citribraziliensis TaxID=989973 RepID=A0ABR1LW79_9PEZI